MGIRRLGQGVWELSQKTAKNSQFSIQHSQFLRLNRYPDLQIG
jgi:hypothetical protein